MKCLDYQGLSYAMSTRCFNHQSKAVEFLSLSWKYCIGMALIAFIMYMLLGKLLTRRVTIGFLSSESCIVVWLLR